MTDKKIEEYLAQAVEKNTPDILDDILKDIDRIEAPMAVHEEEPGKVWEEVRAGNGQVSGGQGRKLTGRYKKIAAGIAAAFVIFLGGSAMLGKMHETFAVVGLDVNPSIEMSISKSEKILDAKAINEEGEAILSGMDLKGTDVNTACNAIVGAMLTKGYLSSTSNSILVSVRSQDTEKGKAIERTLADNLNSYLGDSDISPAILGQYVEEDDELEAFADSHGISEGKAWLIRNLLASGSTKMTEESLLRLSTQELILLGQERNVSAESTFGAVDTSKYIGSDTAVDKALSDAGTDKNKAAGVKVEFDADDGAIVYEVEFTSGG